MCVVGGGRWRKWLWLVCGSKDVKCMRLGDRQDADCYGLSPMYIEVKVVEDELSLLGRGWHKKYTFKVLFLHR